MKRLSIDKRSQKIVVTSHCVFNQNSKLEGIANWPGMINEITELIQKSGCGVLQMACPEMLYEGIGRFDKSYEQYDCSEFRLICHRIAKETVQQISNYQKWGYEVCSILAIDGSPSCGFNLTQSAPEWRGLVAGQHWEKVRYIPKKGILFEELTDFLNTNDTNIPIVGVPEIPELGDIEVTLKKLEMLLFSEKGGVEL